jgi:hypothetical protein
MVMGEVVSFPELPERCLTYGFDPGRCQLKRGHHEPHAVRYEDGYLTWDVRQVSRWSSTALWLFDLPWADGLQPMPADL